MSDWDDPAESDFFTIKDYVGSLCLIAVNGFTPKFPTAMGERDTVRAEIVVVDGPKKGAHYDEALLFGAKLVPQLKGKIGSVVLGRIDRGLAKAGQSAPYILEKASKEDAALANAWVKAHGGIDSHPTASAKPVPRPEMAYAGADEEPPF